MGIHRKIASACCACILLYHPLAVSAVTLGQAYQAALINDPYLQAAYHAYQSGKEDENIGYSRLLPEVTYSARKAGNKGQRETTNMFGTFNDPLRYTSSSTGIYLRQSLFSAEKFALGRQGVLQSEISGQQYRSSSQELVLRVASAYLDVVVAKAGLSYADAVVRAADAQYRQAQRMQAAGESAEYEIDAAKARLQLAEVQRMEYTDRHSEARYILEEMTQSPLGESSMLNTSIELNSGIEESLETAISHAMAQSPIVQEKTIAVAAAAENKNKAAAGYLPTLDFVASYANSSQDSPAVIGQHYKIRMVGVEMQWPLFNGGQSMFLARKAESQVQQAKNEEQISRIKVRVEVSRQYHVVKSAMEKARALDEAKRAGERGLEAMRNGARMGVRTLVEVLNAERDLAQTELDHADTMRNYIVAVLKLNDAMGELHEDKLIWVEQYLMNNSVQSPQ